MEAKLVAVKTGKKIKTYPGGPVYDLVEYWILKDGKWIKK